LVLRRVHLRGVLLFIVGLIGCSAGIGWFFGGTFISFLGGLLPVIVLIREALRPSLLQVAELERVDSQLRDGAHAIFIQQLALISPEEGWRGQSPGSALSYLPNWKILPHQEGAHEVVIERSFGKKTATIWIPVRELEQSSEKELAYLFMHSIRLTQEPQLAWVTYWMNLNRRFLSWIPQAHRDFLLRKGGPNQSLFWGSGVTPWGALWSAWTLGVIVLLERLWFGAAQLDSPPTKNKPFLYPKSPLSDFLRKG